MSHILTECAVFLFCLFWGDLFQYCSNLGMNWPAEKKTTTKYDLVLENSKTEIVKGLVLTVAN